MRLVDHAHLSDELLIDQSECTRSDKVVNNSRAMPLILKTKFVFYHTITPSVRYNILPTLYREEKRKFTKILRKSYETLIYLLVL